MHRIALNLSAFLLVSVAVAVAQLGERLPEAPLLDCGYVCVFAQSTESVDQSATVGEQPPEWASAPAQTLFSQALPANLGGVSGSGNAR
jgi:hypothetical protein